MTLTEARQRIGFPVLWNRRDRGHHRPVVGRIIALHSDDAVVFRPGKRHRVDEIVPLDQLSVWKKGEHEYLQRTGNQ